MHPEQALWRRKTFSQIRRTTNHLYIVGTVPGRHDSGLLNAVQKRYESDDRKIQALLHLLQNFTATLGLAFTLYHHLELGRSEKHHLKTRNRGTSFC